MPESCVAAACAACVSTWLGEAQPGPVRYNFKKEGYPTCCPLFRFSHIGEHLTKGALKMLSATGHARMVNRRETL